MVAHGKLHASEHAVSGGDDVHSYITHNSVQGLTTGDTHTQYVNKNGRATGQTVIGGTGASENLTLSSTAHGTKGKIMCQDELDLNTKAISNVGNVDGVDVSAHAGGDAKAQHTGGLGSHTHQSAGSEGNQLDHGAALTGLLDDDHTIYTKADGTRAFSGDQSMGNHKITSVTNPVNQQDAATKAYVDSTAQGLDWQDSVLNKTPTEPVGPVTGDRYLIEGAGSDLITAVDQPGKKFKHTGDVSANYAAQDTIKVLFSTGNDGLYTVVAVVFVGGVTEVTVSETIPNPTADGNMSYADNPGSSWAQAGPDSIVEYDGAAWDRTAPNEGMAVWEEDDNRLWVYADTTWVQFGSTLDHGALEGLADDDHTQYLLVDGTRAMTGNLDMDSHNVNNVVDINMEGNIVGVGNVDGGGPFGDHRFQDTAQEIRLGTAAVFG